MRDLTIQNLNPHSYPTSDDQLSNMNTLLVVVNATQKEYGVQFVVTSGLRSLADQQRINPTAPKSAHLEGQAVDIRDADLKLAAWTKANLDLMEKLGLFMEDFDHTRGWVHYTIREPKSKKRVFIP